MWDILDALISDNPWLMAGLVVLLLAVVALGLALSWLSDHQGILWPTAGVLAIAAVGLGIAAVVRRSRRP